MAYNVLIVSEQDNVREALSAQCAFADDVAVSLAAHFPTVVDAETDCIVFHAVDAAALPDGWDNVDVPMLCLVDSDSPPAADDVFALPLRVAAVLARMRYKREALARIGDKIFELGAYRFQPAHRALWRADAEERIRLTEKESAMVLYLLQADGVPVGRDELLQKVWGYHVETATHTLETHIYRLRQKIDPDGHYDPLLLTDVAGYRLNL